MTSDWAKAGSVASDMAAQQGKVGELLHILRAAAVLRDAHAVDNDRALGLHIDLRGMFDVAAHKPGMTLDVGPLCGLQVADERVDAERVAADEIPIENFRLPALPRGMIGFNQKFHHSLDDGYV